MKSATLLRTSSIPVQKLSLTSNPIKSSISYSSGDVICRARSRSCGNLLSELSTQLQTGGILRHVVSESNMIRSEHKLGRMSSRIGSSCSIPGISEEETEDVGSWAVAREEMGSFFGGGSGGIDGGGRYRYGGERRSGGGDQDRKKMGEYYEEMVKSNPGDAVLLRNYGKYLHEVEKNAGKAEEYYGRAILASDEIDGELFSLYGKLIWEAERDEDRAKSYFDQAVHASPNDCTVLGSYAHFLWEVADEGGGEEEEMETESAVVASPALVGAK